MDTNKNHLPQSSLHSSPQSSLHSSPQSDITKESIVSWNKNIEENVKQIGEKAKGYKIMHIQEAHVISKRYRYLMYAGILLGPLAGLLSGIAAIIDSSNNSRVELPIAATCAGFISGIVVAITKFGKFEEKSSSHKLSASKYTSLESNVKRQLILSKTDRVEASKYLEWIGNSFDDLFLSSPLLDRKIYTNYVKIAKKNGITVPDEYELSIFIDKTNNEIKDVKNSNFKKEIDFSKEIKRTKTLSTFPELNHFSDGRMLYEMQRMMDIKK